MPSFSCVLTHRLSLSTRTRLKGAGHDRVALRADGQGGQGTSYLEIYLLNVFGIVYLFAPALSLLASFSIHNISRKHRILVIATLLCILVAPGIILLLRHPLTHTPMLVYDTFIFWIPQLVVGWPVFDIFHAILDERQNESIKKQ